MSCQDSSRVPDFLRKIIDVADSPEDGDILLLGTLTVLSACLPQIEGIFNKRPVSSNLFLFVTARASQIYWKSIVRRMVWTLRE